MSRKKINIILIAVTVGVYGAIMYKYFGGGQSPLENIPLALEPDPVDIQDKVAPQEPFVLQLNDRDPFLDKTYRKRIAQERKNTTLKVPVSKAMYSAPLPWPSIEYLGFTKSNAQKNRTAILRIDGKLYRKRQGSVINDLKILQVRDDSIQLQFQKKRQYFNRQ